MPYTPQSNVVTGYGMQKKVLDESDSYSTPDLDFDKIKLNATVLVRFELK